jgi:cold shock CspA family protein
VLQFDHARGYGFIAAEDGGDDIFLHSSVFDGDSDMLVPGMRVEFQVMAGDRGRKAFAAHLLSDEFDAEDRPAGPAGVPSAESAPAPAVRVVLDPHPATEAHVAPDDEQMCDVLAPAEFQQELTELLLNAVPELTGQQIRQVRQSMLELAKKHGWCDG